MLRVKHLRELAATCRNLAGNLPDDRAIPLRELADSYDFKAERRLIQVQGGFVTEATSKHPHQSM